MFGRRASAGGVGGVGGSEESVGGGVGGVGGSEESREREREVTRVPGTPVAARSRMLPGNAGRRRRSSRLGGRKKLPVAK